MLRTERLSHKPRLFCFAPANEDLLVPCTLVQLNARLHWGDARPHSQTRRGPRRKSEKVEVLDRLGRRPFSTGNHEFRYRRPAQGCCAALPVGPCRMRDCRCAAIQIRQNPVRSYPELTRSRIAGFTGVLRPPQSSRLPLSAARSRRLRSLPRLPEQLDGL
jgi:hypothetical protein